jgi:hypothetical protein
MAEVPRRATPLAETELGGRLLEAWRSTGLPLLPRAGLELLLALLFIENGRGRSIIQHNWGNLSSRARETDTYWRPPWFDAAEVAAIADPAKRERMQAIHERMVAGREPKAFEAHPSHEAGARRWIKRLHERFGGLVDAAATGDALAFAKAYGESGYCASPICQDEDRFAETFGELAARIRARGDIPPDADAGDVVAGLPPSPAPRGGTAGGAATAMVMLAAVGIGGAWWYSRRKRS